MLKQLGDRMDGLIHRSHANHGPKNVSLSEFSPDRDSQMVIQCCDDMGTTFFWSEDATISAGGSLISGQSYKRPPAIYIDPSVFGRIFDSTTILQVFKLANY